MKKLFLLFLLSLLFISCSKEKKIDAKLALETSCKKCHNLDMPPIIPKVELAPPMMAIVFHLKDFIKTINPSEHKSKFSNFVSDYIINPSKEKAYCDEKSIKKYGLMPSLKNELSNNEARQIASYIYDKYDAKKFYAKEKIKREFKALPKGEQLIRKNGCISCHHISKVKIAPSFKQISKNSNKKEIIFTILQGSKGKYKGFEKSFMPVLGKNLSEEDLENIANWILTL